MTMKTMAMWLTAGHESKAFADLVQYVLSLPGNGSVVLSLGFSFIKGVAVGVLLYNITLGSRLNF
jgi:hypothetical protein